MVSFNLKYSEIEGLTRLDPEYYNPKYNDVVKKVRNLNSVKLSTILNIELGPAYSSKKIKKNGDIPISKIGDVTNKRDFSNWDFVDFNEFVKYGKRNIKQNEILMTLTGDPPDVGKVNMPFTDYENEKLTLAFNQRVAKLETKGINPFYLFTILSTEYFRIRFEQCAFGIRQRNVSIPDLKSAFVYLAEPIEIEKIGKLTKEHFKLKSQSQTLYKQAIDLLEQGLGMDGVNFEKPKSYTANFSEVVSNFRNDADYYQTKYRQLDTHLKTKVTVALSSICNFLKGFEVGTSLYTLEGPVFIRVSNLTKDGFKFGNADKHISETTHSSLKSFQPIIGDILLTKDGTIGTCYVVDENLKGIISSGIMNLELTDNTIPKEYLALVINSKICQMQAERECSGALITHWKPEQIRRLRIPILMKENMQEISELVVKSKEARKQSQQLLADAKARVEQLIEEAAKNNA